MSRLSAAKNPLALLLMALSILAGAVTHGFHLFLYPLYATDEGIYMQQAWSVLRQARLSPYTYFYDHAPAGWVLIAAWCEFLPGQFQTFGSAINTGRILMLLLHMANVFFLFQITRKLTGSLLAAVFACFLFSFSPLAVFYQRKVLLDNVMVFWLLLSLYLVLRGDRRIVTAMLAGLAFGIAVITKENAIFFAPVLGYLLLHEVQKATNRRFATAFWNLAAFGPVSLYTLYASLKNELLPSNLNFSLENPPADHVALLYTIWWQLHRSQGTILDPKSLFWQFSLGTWLPKDRFILIGGGLAMLVGLFVGLRQRERHFGVLVGALLSASYAIYLVRGSVMLDFYIVPLLPFLALNIASMTTLVLRPVPAFVRWPLVVGLMVLLALPIGGYVQARNDRGQVAWHDLYLVPLTPVQNDEVAYLRQNIAPDRRIVIDDDIWADLHDRKPYYPYAHSHWKAAGDPDVRDKLFHKDWRNIDYVVMSNKMRLAMDQNNGDGNESWILDAIDNHSTRVWVEQRGDVQVEVYRVNSEPAPANP
jgi:4-amino-4-deoxy-L-arabinose transferase-like glycosyltransferase